MATVNIEFRVRGSVNSLRMEPAFDDRGLLSGFRDTLNGARYTQDELAERLDDRGTLTVTLSDDAVAGYDDDAVHGALAPEARPAIFHMLRGESAPPPPLMYASIEYDLEPGMLGSFDGDSLRTVSSPDDVMIESMSGPGEDVGER